LDYKNQENLFKIGAKFLKLIGAEKSIKDDYYSKLRFGNIWAFANLFERLNIKTHIAEKLQI
jgi:hypothetical protein